MPDAILTLNAGSSSIKFSLFDTNLPQGAVVPPVRVTGEIEKIGIAPHFKVRDAHGKTLAEKTWAHGDGLSHEAVLGTLLKWVTTHLDGATLWAAGHRIVHGGADFFAPVRLDAANLAALDALAPLAPLHEVHNLAAVRAVMALQPNLPQIGCFDTGFHHGHPAVASRMAIPRRFAEQGMRRYGFHGLSYEYIARTLQKIAPDEAKGRVIAAHLGNGASLCAMLAGNSIDSTMGMTALDGLIMGTRSGSLDPGALLYLMQTEKLDPDAVTKLLYNQSGLLGISGVSADMRELLASSDPHAAEAVESFTYRAARDAGALTSVLGGLDTLIFTAGIGEHSAPVRAMISQRLGWLGVAIDQAANLRHDAVISTPDSRVTVRVIPTNEDGMIARHCLEVLNT